MVIQIDKAPRCIWHTDCPENKWNSGICAEVEHEERRTLIQCGHCGARGYIPNGTVFGARVRIENA